MRRILKFFVIKYLVFFAKKAIRKNSPLIIAITGSVGKTTTREAVFRVAKAKYKAILQNHANYNTDIGICLSIFGEKTAARNPLRWLFILVKILFANPKFDCLILECAADRMGDIDNTLKIFSPQIAIFTNVCPVHIEKFGKLENIFQEKRKLIKAAKEAVLNFDDVRVGSMPHVRRRTFGFSGSADIFVKEYKNTKKGIRGKIFYCPEKKELEKELLLSGDLSRTKGKNTKSYYNEYKFTAEMLGVHNFYAILSAILVGDKIGISVEKSIKVLQKMKLPPGRGGIRQGIKNTKIIDSSYNSSPDSLRTSLDILKIFSQRKVLILGEMLELGKDANKVHAKLGAEIAKSADIVFAVGSLAKNFYSSKFPKKNFFYYKNSKLLAKDIKSKIKERDLIFIKGSAGTRLNLVVDELTKKTTRK